MFHIFYRLPQKHGMVTFAKLGQKKVDVREGKIRLSESIAENDYQIEQFITMDNEAREWEKASQSDFSISRKFQPSPNRMFESKSIRVVNDVSVKSISGKFNQYSSGGDNQQVEYKLKTQRSISAIQSPKNRR